MTRYQRAASTVSLLAELSHVFCCGLPILVAVMTTGTQIGLGGFFLSYHGLIHDYERLILIGSGVLLALGLALHYVSYQISCRAVCEHGPCETQKFRVGWIFTIALTLYVANLIFYFASGHGTELPRFD